MTEQNHKEYLGDSVYVEMESGMVKLTTDNGYPDDSRNVIYLEIEVVYSLEQWLKRGKEESRKCL